jgi:hypothetical protein
MQVNPRDGCCRSCGGTLEIIDCDNCTMTVLCTEAECGDSYPVETDAFGDGGVIYHFEMIARQLRKEKP